jgi:CRP/FNR family transcriptional regulator, cyclic AMP receptor protein
MTTVDALGYVASSLVLATFTAKSMVGLRALTIGSNLAFIAYSLSPRYGRSCCCTQSCCR